MSDAADSKPKLGSRLARPMLAGALVAVSSLPAQAATDVFLQLDGIKGESTDAKHKEWIEIRSYSQGFSNPASTGVGGGGGAGKVSCGDVNVMKSIDIASPKLMEAVMTGKHIAKGTLAFRSVSGKGDTDYYTVVLSEIFVTSVQQSDSASDGTRITESVSLAASKFEFSYRTQKADGSLDTPKTFTFDCKANRAF
ncbi:Hcp family type VI secretion system effector [Paucibacter soli]|uniref:Hcp family type VI secretion system effector n=1 Tax=Paucibacter soli TaxID=3133433 RepID=UPI0030A945F4